MNERIIRRSGEYDQLLQPQITNASLNRTIGFIFPTEEAAKAGAIKVMSVIHLDREMQTAIQNVDLTRRKGNIGWDYHGIPLKTYLDFEQLQDGNWALEIDKFNSEETNLRSRFEDALGEHSVASDAYIHLKFPNAEQGREYLETVGMDLSPEKLGNIAQESVYWNLAILLRDMSHQHNHITGRTKFDRPGDMGRVLVDFARQSDRDTQIKILTVVDRQFSKVKSEELIKPKNKYPGGSLEIASKIDDFDPVTALQGIFEIMDKSAKRRTLFGSKLPPGEYSHFYLDSLLEAYKGIDNKADLFDTLYNKCKQRVEEEKGATMVTEVRFGGQSQSRGFYGSSLNINYEAPFGSEHFRAHVSTNVDGVFDMTSRTFRPDDYPTEFSVRVFPTPAHKYSTDPSVQEYINAAASILALQDPGFLDRKNAHAKRDTSHYEVFSELGVSLYTSAIPYFQHAGSRLLTKRE